MVMKLFGYLVVFKQWFQLRQTMKIFQYHVAINGLQQNKECNKIMGHCVAFACFLRHVLLFISILLKGT